MTRGRGHHRVGGQTTPAGCRRAPPGPGHGSLRGQTSLLAPRRASQRPRRLSAPQSSRRGGPMGHPGQPGPAAADPDPGGTAGPGPGPLPPGLRSGAGPEQRVFPRLRDVA